MYADNRKLPLRSERVIAALPEGHPLADRSILHWTDWPANRCCFSSAVLG
jgi:hypothetical protein